MNQILPSTLELIPSIRVLDEWQEVIPEDLYIPPAAFEILLEQFEGPLDFLIYLIQKNGFDLLQLDISPIATQYLSYMDSMKSLNIELTADYMVMAALLADLKSRLLLPKPKVVDQFEKDPKQALPTIKGLAEYIEKYNRTAVIFPEGTRSKNGIPKKFSENGLKILCKFAPNAIIIPITINNSWKMTKFGFFPMGLGNNIQFYIHNPIPVKDYTFADLMQKTESKIITNINEYKQNKI